MFSAQFADLSQNLFSGSNSLPAARIGHPVVLLILPLLLFSLFIGGLIGLAFVGISTLFHGVLFGFVANMVLNFLLRKRLPKPPTMALRWAGFGGLLVFICILWLSTINPLLSQLGSHPLPLWPIQNSFEMFGEMGLVTCLLFGFLGWVRSWFKGTR